MLKNSSSPIYDNALIIGATSELGMRLIRPLLPYVRKMTLVGRDPHVLQKLSEKYGSHVETLCIDLLSLESKHILFEHIEKNSYDLLVQLQGIGCYGHFESVSLKQHYDLFMVNLFSMVEIDHIFIRSQKDPSKKKLILHTSSLAGYVHCPFSASYGATKSALTYLGKTLNIELAPFFAVASICPGSFGRAFAKKASSGKFEKSNSEEAYFAKVIDTFIKVVETKKARSFCSKWDVLKALLAYFTPKKVVQKVFEEKLLKRVQK